MDEETKPKPEEQQPDAAALARAMREAMTKTPADPSPAVWDDAAFDAAVWAD